MFANARATSASGSRAVFTAVRQQHPCPLDPARRRKRMRRPRYPKPTRATSITADCGGSNRLPPRCRGSATPTLRISSPDGTGPSWIHVHHYPPGTSISGPRNRCTGTAPSHHRRDLPAATAADRSPRRFVGIDRAAGSGHDRTEGRPRARRRAPTERASKASNCPMVKALTLTG